MGGRSCSLKVVKESVKKLTRKYFEIEEVMTF
jgi:hypothetical protein